MKKKIDNKLIIFILVIVFIISLNYNNIIDYFHLEKDYLEKIKKKIKTKIKIL